MKTYYVFLTITENGRTFQSEVAEIAYNEQDACNKAVSGWGNATVTVKTCFRGV